MDKKLFLLYTDPHSSASFTNPGRLYHAAKKAGLNVTRKYVKNFLEGHALYTKFRGRRYRFKRSTIIATGLDYCWETDLLHITDFSHANGGMRYLCIIVDCLSSFLWVCAIKRKTTKNVHDCFEKIFKETKRAPCFLSSDAG